MAVCAGLVVTGVAITLGSLPGRANDDNNGKGKGHDDDHHGIESRVIKGFAIAPVHLDLNGKDRGLVGLGSYLVNAVGGCNDCHTNPPYTADGDPFAGKPKKVNADGYLGGGTAFGPFTSRNITPDKTGKAEGGHSLSDFLQIMRTGIDLDHAHPNLPPPANGALLQVMPWPVYQNMSDHDLRAIYEYLSAIPCVEGGPGEPPNRCK
jgi:hypothetical protein